LYDQYFNFIVTISGSSDSIDYEDGSHQSSKTHDYIMNQLVSLDTHDMTVISGESSKQTQLLLNEAATTDTPIQQYMDTDLADQVEYRQFKSMDIDNSPDNIFYKVVQANPDVFNNVTNKDVHVDDVTTFNKNQFDNNFKTNDFQPLQDDPNADLRDISINDAFGFKLKADYNTYTYDELKLLSARFKIMINGVFDDDIIKTQIQNLANTLNETNYDTYYNAHGKNESVYLKGYRITIDYMDTSPHIWYFDN
jgi:hypothetical protein